MLPAAVIFPAGLCLMIPQYTQIPPDLVQAYKQHGHLFVTSFATTAMRGARCGAPGAVIGGNWKLFCRGYQRVRGGIGRP